MADYNHQEIEQKWQQKWAEQQIYRTENEFGKPKFYVLDMFPYPSGAGLHVGHPLGYIASDIVSRYKRQKGFNVLHPMGFDSFGLPAEQYAIETGQHPAITTEQNIKTFKKQLNRIGFCFDWNREVQTSSPDYYKWTQWIFQQLFNSWYDRKQNKAVGIESLIAHFEANGTEGVEAVCPDETPSFSAAQWKAFSEKEKSDILLDYRLTYLSEAVVNWCPALGTVLANDEIKDGFSERGGHPVERKKMRQWMMRITAYADRLASNLDKLDWSEPMKDMQRNWIGKSIGCELTFQVKGSPITLAAFTTRPDTIFGVTYVVLAPEHELIGQLTTADQKAEVEAYVEKAVNRSERERMADVKTVSGVFTGSYVVNPLTNEEVPLWVADYVLAGYGTGVVMAVPSSDDRDFRFANHFGLPIRCVIEGTEGLQDPTEIKDGKLINSGFLNGFMGEKISSDGKGEGAKAAIAKAEELGSGKAKVNYRMRDAVFSRQRYWGEPVPVYFENGIPKLVPQEQLPLELPEVSEYKPTAEGEPPLGRATNWKFKGEHAYELTTMPGWAGSSWYFLRYMDAHNQEALVDKKVADYWNSVDLYIGGTEHATGHLLYSRFWTMFLYDRGFIGFEEPFQKLVNQGMIQGKSALVYKVKTEDKFVSAGLKDQYETSELHIDIKLVNGGDELDLGGFKAWRPEYAQAEFVLENGKYKCGSQVEKMSKRWYNVVNPDDVCEQYGADVLRMYEMFLGPLEASKPWDTQGIDGVSKFLRKLWRLFHDNNGALEISEDAPTPEELKILHKTIKKVEEDINNLSFNTSVSTFMICVNELQSLKCNKRAILEPLLVTLSSFAPHITEELWEKLGHTSSIVKADFPAVIEAYLTEDSFEYPVTINGKVRTKMTFALDLPAAEVEKQVMTSAEVQKWTEGKEVAKFIFVPKRIVNVVVK